MLEAERIVPQWISVLSFWIRATKEMTQDWKLGIDVREHRWTQELYEPPLLKTFMERILHVVSFHQKLDVDTLIEQTR